MTFGVSATSFAVNISLKRNVNELVNKYPLAAEVVYESFFVDESLTGACGKGVLT